MSVEDREADEAWDAYRHAGELFSNESMTAWLDEWGSEEEESMPGDGMPRPIRSVFRRP